MYVNKPHVYILKKYGLNLERGIIIPFLVFLN